ncbi:MAG: molybdopterin-dependent oxidoreductase [Gammaproteobacteria bacterium]
MKRRNFLKWASGGLAVNVGSGLIARLARAAPQAGEAAEPSSGLPETLPGKKPLLKKSFRPPNYETPPAYFKEIFTPNEAFFVRYHLADIPQLNAQTWRLHIGGDALKKPLELTLADLMQQFETVEIAAVNQCAGNRRGLVQPHVPGVQWGYGAMGNARWKGVRLRDVLNQGGIKKTALEVAFDGADRGVLPGVPDFVKSLPLEKALDANTLIAFAMNGAPLPHWNGYPARLVVPGWTGTYWVKHLTTINVVAEPYGGFWMKTAYRLPKGVFPNLAPFVSQETAINTPITELTVNSLITNIEDGQTFHAGRRVDVEGIAWDGGHGIARVEISTDHGQTWQRAELGKDYGRFSWRQWHYRVKPQAKGLYPIAVKAVNRDGAAQPLQLFQNPGGYHHNRVQMLTLRIV